MLKVYGLDQASAWDSVVQSFEEYDVYWLSGYVKAFQIHGDGDPILFSYDDGETRGINVIIKRDIAKDENFIGVIPEEKYYDFVTPYGYGGWIIEGDSGKVLSAYEEWIHNNEIICEFVRFHPIIGNHRKLDKFYDVVQLGEVVHMDVSSPETIWNNLTSKNRNMIRKAMKNNIKVFNGRFPEIFKKFREIYNDTMDRDAADAYYYFDSRFYESILEDLSQNAQVFWAEKDDQVIAASIIIGANGYLNYHLSGSLKEFRSLAPSNLILYYASLWGCANGYKTFYLGGGVGSGEDSLFRFKRSFYKGDLNHFYIGKRIYNTRKYDELVALRKKIYNQNYFPAYRG